MALPELERTRVENLLKKFAARVPPHARTQLWYEFTVRTNTVTLIECRPYYLDATVTTRHPFARFLFDPKAVLWTLKCRDRNQLWHVHQPLATSRHFAELLAEVERHPIFLG